jgi:hypothetical protein
MAVTNQAGDVLSLDESCGLDLSLAAASSSTTSRGVGGNMPTPTAHQSAAGLKGGGIVTSALRVLFAASLAVVLANVI